MQKNRLLPRLISSLFLIAMIWCGFFIASFALQTPQNTNLEYIPENTVSAIRIDGRELINTALSSVILDEDEEVVRLVHELLTKDSDTDEDEQKSFPGIALNSDILLFTAPSGPHLITGALVNLENPDRFASSIEDYLSEHEAYAVNGNVGIIISEKQKDRQSYLTQEQLKDLARVYLSKKSEFDTEQLFSAKEGRFVLESWSKQGAIKNGDIWSNTNLQFQVNEQELLIQGSVQLPHPDNQFMSKVLKPKGLHISADEISGEINDTLSYFMENLGIPTENMHGISLNYYGTDIVEEGGFYIVPNFDGLFYLNEQHDFKTVIDSLGITNEAISNVKIGSFEYGLRTFWFEQVDAKTIRISRSEKVDYQKNEANTILFATGDMTALTHLTGDGMMRNIIEVFPQYTASRLFAEKIDSLEFKLIKGTDGTADIEGVIHFNENDRALNAVIKLLLVGGFVSLN